MSRIFQTLTAEVATLILTGCANTHNPLEDYEQVEPADLAGSKSSLY